MPRGTTVHVAPGDKVVSATVNGTVLVAQTAVVTVTAPPATLVDRLVYLGTDTQYLVRLDDGSEVSVRTQNAHRAARSRSPGRAEPQRRTAVTFAVRLVSVREPWRHAIRR